MSALTMMRNARRSGNRAELEEARYNLDLYHDITENSLLRAKCAEALLEDDYLSSCAKMARPQPA